MEKIAELICVVDEYNHEIDAVNQPQVYKDKLHHRIVHVLVINKQDEWLLQKRSPNKSGFPGHWSTSVGGHVATKETIIEAALRETSEEIGVEVETLEHLFEVKYWSPQGGMYKFMTIYKLVHDGPFTYPDNEVSELKFCSQKTIKSMIAEGEPFHPELLFIMKKLGCI